MTVRRSNAFLLGLLFLTACAQDSAESSSGDRPELRMLSAEGSVIQAYTSAFNAHDPEAMRALMADDIVWLSIVGDSVVVEARGSEALASGMEAYFADFPDVQSVVEISSEMGAYVHSRETATWSRDGVRSSQSSLSTYEIRNGKVRRVWYFPSS